MSLPIHEIELHGHKFSYRMAGRGPVVVLLHGITCSSETWEGIIPALAKHFTVIAPDLLGHGGSAKPRNEYSVSAYANAVRDLLVALGQTRATVVGHSLGGGVALQFSYQFPEMVERLVLEATGGLGRELHPVLRAASVPGAAWLLPRLCTPGLHRVVDGATRVLGRAGLRASTDIREVWRGFKTLRDDGARDAFVQTVRGAIDLGGQRASALDRLHLTARLPTLIVWGEEDRIIPVEHGRAGHAGIDGSRLEVFPEAGHFPHLDCPLRFVSVLTDFLQSTKPAWVDALQLGAAGRERGAGAPSSVELRAA